jgi:uncharacterized membrane protein
VVGKALPATIVLRAAVHGISLCSVNHEKVIVDRRTRKVIQTIE